MEQSPIAAAILCILGFFIVSWLTVRFNRIFNIRFPDIVNFIIFILVILILIGERELFFQESSTLTGLTVGILLAILWNIKDKQFFRNMIKTVLSLRFLLWAGATGIGIYRREVLYKAWERFILINSTVYKMRIVFFIIIIFLYIMGSVFILFPESRTSSPEKNIGFTMVRNSKKSKKIFKQIFGTLMVLLSSALLHEALTFFANRF